MIGIDYPFHYDLPAVAPAGVDEHFIQSKAIALAEERFEVEAFAVPNAARRGRNLARKMKQEGLRAGAADTVFTWARAGVAFIEFKPRKKSLSDEQWLWLVRMHNRGHVVAVCRHWLTCLEVLERAGAPRRIMVA